MAAGSEKFAWKRYPGVPRVCAACGRTLRVEDVGRVHTTVDYESGVGITRTVFYCLPDEAAAWSVF